MSYNKTTWANGDVITAEKLNHMEDGIADVGGGSGVGMFVNIDPDNDTFDKTFHEIKTAMESGQAVWCIYPDGGLGASIYNVIQIAYDGISHFDVYLTTVGDDSIGFSRYSCESENGYPTYAS